MGNIRDIFIKFGNDYLKEYKLNQEQLKFYHDILSCKTKDNGYHIYKCNHCNNKVFIYNSCNSRYCPNCSEYKRLLWINNHKDDIINTKYLHVVLSIPPELHQVFYQNKLVCYNLLMKVSSKTIQELSKGTLGILSIMHTWTQIGNYHPHIHMLVTDGYLLDNKWIDNININISKLEKVFRNNLLEELRNTKLTFYNDLEYLNDKLNYLEYLDKLKDIRFICYKKNPFNGVDSVYEYLSKYVYRVCMTNDKILRINNKSVSRYE